MVKNTSKSMKGIKEYEKKMLELMNHMSGRCQNCLSQATKGSELES